MGLRNGWRDLRAFIHLTREGRYIGDAVILKSQFGRFDANPELKSHFEKQNFRLPDFGDVEFDRMPEATLGRAYADFMRRYQLKPFLFSGRYQDRVRAHFLPIYYATVHDLIHVITGFDASLAGEAGVWGVMAGQRISPQADRALRMARWLFPLASPRQTVAIQRAALEGEALGRAAAPLLTLDFAAELTSPLKELRERLHVRPARTAPITR